MAKRSKLSQSDLAAARANRTAARPWEGSKPSMSKVTPPKAGAGKTQKIIPTPVKLAAAAGGTYYAHRKLSKMPKDQRTALMNKTVKKLSGR